VSTTKTDDLISSLVLLAVGAVVSVFLVPYFANRWQLHQKGLEIKVDLVRRISKNVMRIMTLIESVEKADDLKELELDKEIRNFKVDNNAIGTELESYYHDEKIGMAWDALRKEILGYYEQGKKVEKNSDEKQKTNRKKRKILETKHCRPIKKR
jgi:hypothetical protein